MDIGGDKELPYMNFRKKRTRSRLARRAYRHGSQRDPLRDQFRAILRPLSVTAHGSLMIISVDEVRALRKEIEIYKQTA